VNEEEARRRSLHNKEKFKNLKLWARQSDKDMAGEDGEDLARKAFVALGLTYTDIDQSPGTLDPALKAAGGKRADFLVKTGRSDQKLFVDAKQHGTDGGKVFRISEAEFKQYQCLQLFESKLNPGVTVEVALMVFPKEALGRCFAMLWLEFFEGAHPCTVPKTINGKRTEVPGFEVQISAVLNDSETGEPWVGTMLIG
jgi:hypothetical protein